ncbi:MAG: hypothetical protein QF890_07955 [Myxococcota bacterium]|nr:hypothetical protein [Deltaproteobacteria bacterium]MCP4241542.1 hypothetical protein [bacterium]MDP7075048.1 hypothetical protein [Myxococcota bacterium]MDP7299891.1 hypothetical protein [Myxococcota bacterium]MDP7432491.1 hypothetical protein [Myxococcota bacterium]
MAWWGTFAWGWNVREERYLNAEFGPGYALGIVGLTCMSLLLLYSVRKRLLLEQPLGPLRRWLSVHMFLGLFGPLCILFHANFRLGSLNSSVSLVSMLLVAASGVFGRMLYPHIHVGLMGQKTTLRQVRDEVEVERHAFDDGAGEDSELAGELRELEQLALRDGGILRLEGAARTMLRRRGAFRRRERDATIVRFVDALRGVVRFRIYERLFALWHAVHLPLCFLLFGAAAVHVVAVHLY